MNSSPERRALAQSVKWFDPRRRQAGTWAFILNRISGIGLIVYLFLHLAVLSTLARGPEAYDRFIALAKSPPFVAGELLVVVGGMYHGLNGLRVACTSFGIGVSQQQRLFFILVALVAVGGLIFAVQMF